MGSMRSFTYAQWVALGQNPHKVRPFALENRKARDDGGRGAYYRSRQRKILGIVLHITAGINDYTTNDQSAEATTRWGQTADGASWTGCVDSNSIINCLHPDRVAWVQGVSGYNFNRPLMGLEIGKRTPDWGDAPAWWVAATLRNAAAYCAPYVIENNIPLELVTDREEVQRRINRNVPVGFTYHWRLTPSTRSDPGLAGSRETFPWLAFLVHLRREIDRLRNGTPNPDPVMPPTFPVAHIKWVQGKLNDLGYKTLVIDGKLGPLTTAEVKAFQRDNKLEVDGRPGPITTVSLENVMSEVLAKLDALSRAVTTQGQQITAIRNAQTESDKQLAATLKAVSDNPKLLEELKKQIADLPELNRFLVEGFERFGKGLDYYVRGGLVMDDGHTHFPYDVDSQAEWLDMARANSSWLVDAVTKIAKEQKIELPEAPKSKATHGTRWRKADAKPETPAPRVSG